MFDTLITGGTIADGTGNVGFKADIVVFDPATVHDLATFANPKQFPVGIVYVFVNGEVVIERGDTVGPFLESP